MTLQFAQPVDEAALRNAFVQLQHPEAVVQHASGTDTFVVRTTTLKQPSQTDGGPNQASEREQLVAGLTEQFGSFDILSLDQVSPLVAAEIVRDAVAAAAAFILLYLWWAFRSVPNPWSYGSAAVAGLLHDAFAVLGLFSILGRLFAIELEATFIVAVLTVIGFSVHDSIVVFDRVRENLQRRAGEPFAEVVNNSIVQTLTRSVNTTLTVLLTLIVLPLFGRPAFGRSCSPCCWELALAATHPSFLGHASGELAHRRAQPAPVLPAASTGGRPESSVIT